jgi:hypothetical protein
MQQEEPRSAAEDPESPSQAPPPKSGEEYEKYKETTELPADLEGDEGSEKATDVKTSEQKS